MTFDKILSELKNKKYHPVYFLAGEEAYFIDQISDYIAENVLSEAEKSFNQVILYGKDIDAAAVINAAKRFPMMSSHQVVIVKEAQNIRNIDDLIWYVEKPLSSTILVINYKYKSLDKRKKLYLSIQQNGVYFDSKKLYDDKVPAWISGFLSEKGLTIDPGSCMLLLEFLGNDLGKIVNELNKLIITLPEGEKRINSNHIEKNVGISKDYNNFELNKALGQRNILKANRIVNYFAKNQKDNPMVLTISMLYSFFNKVMIYHFLKDKSRKNAAAELKVNPFFVVDYEIAARSYKPVKVFQIIGLLREYDLKSKGYNNVSTDNGELLKELIYKILH
jgi:DNA polymerase III subunit delta